MPLCKRSIGGETETSGMEDLVREGWRHVRQLNKNFCSVCIAEGAHESGQSNCSCQQLFCEDSVVLECVSSQELFKDIP